MTAQALVGASFGLVIGLALTTSQGLLPSRIRAITGRIRLPRLGPDALRSASLATAAGVVTRWPVAAAAAWVAMRRMETAARRRRESLEQREMKLAIASWAETLRDLTRAGHSIEEALPRAAMAAPPRIRPLLLEAEARREHAGPAVALERLGVALGDRDGDVVILNLIRAAEGQGENLAEVLGILAAAMRRTAAMEAEFDAVQAKPRRSIAWASGIFAALAVYLAVASPDLARFYSTLIGQVVLAGLVAWFVAGVGVVGSIARPVEPERVLGTVEPPLRGPQMSIALAPIGLVTGALALVAVLVRGSLHFIDWAAASGTIGAATVLALLGVGFFYLKDAVTPPLPPLARALAIIEGSASNETGPSLRGAERAVRRVGDALGLPIRVQRRFSVDLRLVEETIEQHLSRRFLGFAVGVLALPTLAALAFALGTPLSLLLPVWTSPALGLLGFAYPSRTLKTRAAQRRESLRYALISFLYAAASSMKSGRSREQAVEDAASSGSGWAFAELRAAHWEAWALQEDIADHLDRLGQELGSDDLRSIAATLAAGGESGAGIADALISKAQSMQDGVVATAKERSSKALEDMDVALVAMVLFPVVAFLAIPAVTQAQAI